MSWFAERRTWIALVGGLLLTSGCYRAHECGEPESCNYDDDDCDFKIDEDFLTEDGIYAVSPEHCGGCGVSCAEVFPTAAETACEVIEEGGSLLARCVLVSCPEGWHRAGDGACAPDAPVLCLPCSEDADCELRLPGARCRDTVGADGGVSLRCLPPCDSEIGGCQPGFVCNADGLCEPQTGLCSCTEETFGAELACLFERDAAYSCAGVQVCTETGLGECEPILGEACNDADDDCDGEVDEDFRDDAGRYVARLHCGGCAQPCVEPGPNMIASCLPAGAGVTCEVECEEGFVDVDGIQANGCECERFDGEGPPPAAGGDADCDGVPDSTDDFIYVTTTGSNTNPGTLERPMRSIQPALVRADAQGKDVLVARGVYDGPFDLVGGVSIFGGYRPDFRDRDLALFPVVVERRGAAAGSPVITCSNVNTETRVEGFIVQATDATQPGAGSTAVYLDDCGPMVTLAALEIRAGRGAPGIRGESSSDRYARVTGGTLEEIDGTDGARGTAGSASGTCRRIAAGAGGSEVCRFSGRNVSGGRGGDADCPSLGCFNGSPCGNAGCTDFTSGGVCDIDAARAVASPNPSASDGQGTAPGDAGDDTYNAPTNRGVCNFCDDNPTLPRTGVRGGDGAEGSDGTAGRGCASGPRIDVATGRLGGGAGANGGDGTDGSGGGGGSPGSGYAVIGGTSGSCDDRSGGAGGGGGSGGCGAPAASGGTGGGTSAGVVIRATSGGSGPTFEDVRIVTASGGEGGAGGSGSAGGVGGGGGLGGSTAFWCSRTGGRGGDGGRGGAGGGGGGGCGGGSHGIVVFDGASPTYVDQLGMATIDRVGVAGRGGSGGFSPGNAGTDGFDGSGDAIFVLP